jgi:hypothetical protein
MSGEDFIGHVERRSKGRYAQRLSAAEGSLQPPDYIERALAHLMA